jgi:hypothetical protein
VRAVSRHGAAARAISIQRRGVQTSLRNDVQLCFYLHPITESESEAA